MEFGVFTEFESPAMNCGGQIPSERVLTSMRLFAEQVIARLA
jgi:hypothetical protein